MKTILVDDELWALKRFEIECSGVEEIELAGQFRSGAEALAFAEDHRVDLALLDIEMPKMNGMELAEKLRELYPDMIIIFVSAYDHYMQEAFRQYQADYFVVKPYSVQDVQDVLKRAKLLSGRLHGVVSIHTFGNFEVTVDGTPIPFTSPKAKELLAILVDRAGESVTAEDAFSLMWSDKPYNHVEAAAYRRALVKLQNTLAAAGIEHILSYYPHARSLRCNMVECDYFRLLKEEPAAIQNYRGYYMTNYAWGEERIPILNRIKIAHDPGAEDFLYD